MRQAVTGFFASVVQRRNVISTRSSPDVALHLFIFVEMCCLFSAGVSQGYSSSFCKESFVLPAKGREIGCKLAGNTVLFEGRPTVTFRIESVAQPVAHLGEVWP